MSWPYLSAETIQNEINDISVAHFMCSYVIVESKADCGFANHRKEFRRYKQCGGLNSVMHRLISRLFSFCQSFIQFKRFPMLCLDWKFYFWYNMKEL